MGLLTRGSRVRVAAGAAFPKEFADLSIEKIARRTQIEKSDRSYEFAPELADPAISRFGRNFEVPQRSLHGCDIETASRSPAMNAGGRLPTAATHGIVGRSDERTARTASNNRPRTREFAALLSVPLETLRPWDSGRRAVARAVLQRARDAVAHHQGQHELLPLDRV